MKQRIVSFTNELGQTAHGVADERKQFAVEPAARLLLLRTTRTHARTAHTTAHAHAHDRRRTSMASVGREMTERVWCHQSGSGIRRWVTSDQRDVYRRVTSRTLNEPSVRTRTHTTHV